MARASRLCVALHSRDVRAGGPSHPRPGPSEPITFHILSPMRTPALLFIAALSLVGVSCNSNPLGLRPGATSVLQVGADPTPAEAVDMALDKHSPDRRYKGTLLLAKQRFAGESVYVELFAERARDEDPGVRAAATRALGLHGRAEHGPLLIERLADADAAVREEAARALQRIHVPDALSPLLGATLAENEAETSVRTEAARALGQFQNPRALEGLIGIIDDESLAVNMATLYSLRTLTGQDFGLDRRAWQTWYNQTSDYFVAGSAYLYPSFSRGKKWFEHIPFVPPPPTDPQGLPIGVSPDRATPQ